MADIPVLIIDCREHKVIERIELEVGPVAHQTKQLDVGDFMYIDPVTRQPLLVIERKTYADLASSIQSGRFYEQKHRLKSFECRFHAYLIEGPYPRKMYGRISASALDSAIMGLAVRDGFSVIHSNNINHTVKLLVKISTKLPNWRDGKSSSSSYEQSSVKIVKKDNLTPESCYLRQLCQIPGVSMTIAQAICKRYPNMISLASSLASDRTGSQKELSEINLGTKRLGKVLSKRIIDFYPTHELDRDRDRDRDREPKKKPTIILKKRRQSQSQSQDS